MNNMNIADEILISLVDNRPVHWKKTSECYGNKQVNFAASKEICKMIHGNVESIEYNCLYLIK